MRASRRNVLAGATSTAMVAMAGSISQPSRAQQSETPPDLIVHNAKVTTLQSNQPEAQAFATRGERIVCWNPSSAASSAPSTGCRRTRTGPRRQQLIALGIGGPAEHIDAYGIGRAADVVASRCEAQDGCLRCRQNGGEYSQAHLDHRPHLS